MKEAGKKTTKSKSAGTSNPLEGKRAPDFQLPDANGHPVKLKDLLGNGPLVLYFYPKDMTPGCTREACDFRDNLERVQSTGAHLVGISTDSPETHQKFISKYELNFPLLSDSSKKTATAYGVYKKKSLYGREFMGIERTTFIVDSDGNVRKVFAKVKVDGHAQAVIDALKELS